MNARIACALLLSLCAASPGWAQERRVLIELEGALPRSALLLPQGEQRPVRMYEILRSQRQTTQAPLRAWLDARGINYRAYTVVNALALEADENVIKEVAQRPEVRAIHQDRWFQLRLAQEEGLAPNEVRAPEASLNTIKAPQVWALGHRGQGVVVASADTGVDWDHPALLQKYRGNGGGTPSHDYDWKDAIHAGGGSCGFNTTAPCDDNSHGTHTVGTMVGSEGANDVGVAPDAKWIGCRNMNQGAGLPSTYLECMDFFLAPTDLNGANPRPELAPHIINNSWGCPPSEECVPVDILREAVANLRQAGMLFVAAAGNSGSSCGSITDPPAIYEESFVVANTTVSDGINGSSSRGPVTVDGSNRLKPDLAAPGTSIRSTIPGTGYGFKTGTSMASPHVAGAAALLMSADPTLRRDPARVEALLKASAQAITVTQTCGGIAGTTFPNPVVGHGRIDVLRAVQMLDVPVMLNGFE